MSSAPLKRVLIISPHFPPVNAADMHRVRHSLPYFREFGWDPITLAVEPRFVEGFRDDLLLETVPDNLQIDRVRALDYRWTRKVGLGSIALRAVPHLALRGSELLKRGAFDLVYFSTTAFAVLVLGPYWKHRFGVPYVVDLQDPWYNDYYETRPKSERPPKYWFSHRLDGILEPLVMRRVDGLIAVTQAYIDDLNERYEEVRSIPSIELPFGVSPVDLEVAKKLSDQRSGLTGNRYIGTYTGVCNSAMVPVLRTLFRALRKGLDTAPELFERVHLRFVGTSYAPHGRARPVVTPIAAEERVLEYVSEVTDRVSYFEALRLQDESSFLLLPGTLDGDYTASKLYPYVLSRKPILGLINARSSVVRTLSELNVDGVVTFAGESDLHEITADVTETWSTMLASLPYEPQTNWDAFERYTAREMTRRQVEVFERVLGSKVS